MCNEGSKHAEVTEATPSGRSFDMKVTESFSGLQIKQGFAHSRQREQCMQRLRERQSFLTQGSQRRPVGLKLSEKGAKGRRGH